MNMSDRIEKIITLATNAPSGENSQPWRFEREGDNIFLYNIPDRDNPIYNYQQSGSHVAHGALLKNMQIIAGNFGYTVDIELFPLGFESDCVAKISFIGCEESVHPLLEAIEKRNTNRNEYEINTIGESVLNNLKKIAMLEKEVSIHFFEDRNVMKEIATAVSFADRFMLEYRPLHDAIFENISWNEVESNEKKMGLYVETMGLKPPEKIVFRLLRKWWFSQFASKIGMTKFIAKENAKKYATASLFAVFVVEGAEKDYVKAGMQMQHIWLELVKNGYAAHPLAGLPYLHMSIKNGSTYEFSNQHIEIIINNCKKIYNVCGLDVKKNIAMILRVGIPKGSVVHSPKLNPDIFQKKAI